MVFIILVVIMYSGTPTKTISMNGIKINVFHSFSRSVFSSFNFWRILIGFHGAMLCEIHFLFFVTFLLATNISAFMLIFEN